MMNVSIASLAFAACALACASIAPAPATAAEQKIAFCHAGLVQLPSFARHIASMRKARRDTAEDIDRLIARNRKGGAAFFSSQIIVQESQSGSGTFDLRLSHGLIDATYRNITAWTCEPEDWPIVYFVGFRVRKIEDN